MITGALLTIFYGVVYALFAFLPAQSSIPSVVVSALQTIGGWGYSVNAFFPIDHLFVVIGLSAVMIVAIFFIRVVRFVLGLIRGSGVGI